MMKFTPPPDNDFRDFFETYFARCRARVPDIRVMAAKWAFEDLIPGLSDFDTRFIVADGMTLDAWHAMSMAVGEVHAELAVEKPSWSRNLEHLPGLNLTVSEVADPRLHYPEYKQWTFYDGDPAVTNSLESALAERSWSDREEIYHLKRIATFFGPYIRGIDPPINIGAWENKYPLHSRFMHYFTPPVQAMVSIALGRTVRGKLESLRLARETLPHPEVIDRVFEALERHYEIPEWYAEPRLGELESTLEGYLGDAWGAITDKVTRIDASLGETRETLREKIAAMPGDPLEEFFSRAKFARLMKGRLLFYARDIPTFDASWLIRNELGRIVDNFFHKPLQAYAKIRYGHAMDAGRLLDALSGDLLEPAEVQGMKAFARLAAAPPAAGEEKHRARAVAEIYEPVLAILEKLRTGLSTGTAPGTMCPASSADTARMEQA